MHARTGIALRVVGTDHPLLVPEGEPAGVQLDGGIRQSRTILPRDEDLHPPEQDETGHRRPPLDDAMTVHHVLDIRGRLKDDTVPRTGVDPGPIAQIRKTVEDKMDCW